jgi:hypothetical protein
LDRFFEQQGQVIDQPVGQTAAAQEGQGQAARPLQGAVVENARPLVPAGVQTFRSAQVDVCEHGLGKLCPVEVRPLVGAARDPHPPFWHRLPGLPIYETTRGTRSAGEAASASPARPGPSRSTGRLSARPRPPWRRGWSHWHPRSRGYPAGIPLCAAERSSRRRSKGSKGGCRQPSKTSSARLASAEKWGVAVGRRTAPRLRRRDAK